MNDTTVFIHISAIRIREGVKKWKKVVILLQPLSIYLPTPIGVQKATFLIFWGCFKMMFKPLLEIKIFLEFFIIHPTVLLEK